jgi:C_GCAxxG_C_C family probable redox protein
VFRRFTNISYYSEKKCENHANESLRQSKKIMDERRGHCAQAIFAPYGEHLRSGKVDFDTCMKISSAFSGGTAQTGNVCGAINGALMTLGLKYGGQDSNEVNKIAIKFLNDFEKINGSIICRKLINLDLITDEDVQHAFKTGAFNNCTKYVEDVAMLLDKLI